MLRWSFATLLRTSEKLFRRTAPRVVSTAQDLDSQHLANIAWAYVPWHTCAAAGGRMLIQIHKKTKFEGQTLSYALCIMIQNKKWRLGRIKMAFITCEAARWTELRRHIYHIPYTEMLRRSLSHSPKEMLFPIQTRSKGKYIPVFGQSFTFSNMSRFYVVPAHRPRHQSN